MEFDSFVLAAVTGDLCEEPAARPHADCVEFRMDLATEPLEQLADYGGELPVLATNRVEWEGGEATDDHERLEDLSVACEHPRVEAVDIELAAVAGGDAVRVVETARDHDVGVVVSTHDFDETPPRAELERLLGQATDIGDVGKAAVHAATLDDALRLLATTRALSAEGERVATMAMGSVGSHTRAVAPVYGSRIGYAPIDPDRATAPGQFDLATLDELVGRLAPAQT